MHPEREAGLLKAVAIFAALAAVATTVAVLVRRPNAGPIELPHRLNRALPLDAPPVARAGNAHP